MSVALDVFAAPPENIDIGGIVVAVSSSRTAQVFHIVDQLSNWDEYCHPQYGRWAARTKLLDQQDRQLLERHAQLRRVRGWGKGFEQAFYVDASIESAAQDAIESKLLSPEEATAEKEILLHFAPKLSDLIDASAPLIAAFKGRLVTEGKRITPFVEKLVRFSEMKGTIRIPLFLAPNPEPGSGGGGYYGGRLVVEVEETPDPLPTLLHECLHSLLWQHKDSIDKAAKSVGLSWVALNEGIAYALAPGMTDNADEADSLGQDLVRDLLRGIRPSDSLAQSHMVAVVIRPVLRAAIDNGETITSFLPKATEKWQKCCAELNRWAK